jgi:phosphotransferase system IIB component
MSPWQLFLQKLDDLFVPPPEMMRHLADLNGGPDTEAFAAALPAGLLEALGGAGNILALSHVALTRVRIVLRRPVEAIDARVQQHGIAVMHCNDGIYHLIAGDAAAALHGELSQRMQALAETV